MLHIKVLGPGCRNCQEVEKVVQEAVADLGIEATVEKVTDYEEIMGYGVMATPGLVIDEQVVSAGRIPKKSEVTSWLATAATPA